MEYLNDGHNECPLCKVQITLTSLTRHMSSTTMAECILRIKAKITGTEAGDRLRQQNEALLSALDDFIDEDDEYAAQPAIHEKHLDDEDLTQLETITHLNTQISEKDALSDIETLPALKKTKYSKIGFLLTGLSEDQRFVIQKSIPAISALFGGAKVLIESEYSPKEVTHILCACAPLGRCPRTLKYLMGIAGKSWIVSINWILDSLACGRVLDEIEFLVVGDEVIKEDSFACQVSRSDPDGLFTGLDFYLAGAYKGLGPSKADLTALIELAGGRIVQSPRPGVILISNNPAGPRPGERSFTWLFDCISRYRLDK